VNQEIVEGAIAFFGYNCISRFSRQLSRRQHNLLRRKTMQLVYRGISYQSTSTDLAIVQQEMNGKYRGIPYRISEVKETMIQAILVMKYRGVEYIKILSR
jgi:Domain of unknown function (DUF4278)